MSMNLYCKEFDVPQTPTWATFLILSNNEKEKPDGGWKGVVRRLRLYWNLERGQKFNRFSTNPELQKTIRESYAERVADLEKALAENRILHFYYL